MEINKDYKIKNATFTYGRTINLGNYESARFEQQVVVEITKDDCTEDEMKELRKEVMTHLKKQIKTEIKKQLQEEVV
jgi:hypothetical protein